MIKIKYIPTGNVFLLPEKTASELKEKAPEEYQILEKNGKKFRDKIKPKSAEAKKSVLEQILEE